MKHGTKLPRTMAQFERSKYDKDKPGEKEGSKADMARDRKQFKALKMNAAKKK